MEGRVKLSQVIEGENAGDVRVWSSWLNIPESASYSFALMDSQDCGGSEIESIDTTANEGKLPGSINLRGDFSSDPALADLADSASIGLRDADDTMFACCNIELQEKSRDRR